MRKKEISKLKENLTCAQTEIFIQRSTEPIPYTIV